MSGGLTKTPVPCCIAVDDRERNEALLAALRAQRNINLIFTRLKTGDFCIDQAVLIERKTAQDFARSIVDGRLFTQALRLAQSPLRPAYVIEGKAEEWNALGLDRPVIQGALISLMLIFDIPVLRSTGPEETARLLCYAGHQLVRARRGNYIPLRRTKAKRRDTRRLRLLQNLPGIGPERARCLLAHFGSVRNCLNADADSLAMVKGIGPSTARKIAETVQEPGGSYAA